MPPPRTSRGDRHRADPQPPDRRRRRPGRALEHPRLADRPRGVAAAVGQRRRNGAAAAFQLRVGAARPPLARRLPFPALGVVPRHRARQAPHRRDWHHVLCRVLRTGAVGATLGGVSFMLSGSFAGWLGWAIGGPVAWSGIIVAGPVLAYRSRRVRPVAARPLGGLRRLRRFPRGLCADGRPLGGRPRHRGAGVLVTQRRLAPWGTPRRRRDGLWVRPLGAVVAAGYLDPRPLGPSRQAGRRFGLHAIVEVFTQGFYGTPVLGSTWFGPANYVESTAYVGVVPSCRGVAVRVAWRRPVVMALVAGTLGRSSPTISAGRGFQTSSTTSVCRRCRSTASSSFSPSRSPCSPGSGATPSSSASTSAR